MKTIRKAPPRKLGFLTVPASFLMALLLVAAPLERTQAQSGERPERTTPNFATQSQLERATELRTAGTAGLQEEIDTIQPSYQIGDRGPGGGTVFFTYDQGRHGLEVARQDLFWSDPDLQTELYEDFTDFDTETARAIVEDFQEVGNRSMIWTDQAFEIPQQVIGTVNPPVLDVEVSDAYDRSWTQQLIDNGTYEALGIEVPEVG